MNNKIKSSYIIVSLLFLISSCKTTLQKSIDKNVINYSTMENAIEGARKDMIEIVKYSKIKKDYDTTQLKNAITKPQLISPISVISQNETENYLGLKLENLFSKKSNQVYLLPYIFDNKVIACTEVAKTKNGWQILQNNNSSLLRDYQKLVQLNPEIINWVKVKTNTQKELSLSLLPTIILTDFNDSFNVYKIFPILSNNEFKNFNIDSIKSASNFFLDEYKKGMTYSLDGKTISLENGYYIYKNGILTLLNSTQNKTQLLEIFNSQLEKIKLNKTRITE
jgi:hypothetical protein